MPQEEGTAAEPWSDATAEDLPFGSLLHRRPASVTTSGDMTVQDGAIDSLYQIFLQLIQWLEIWLRRHMPRTMKITGRR
jgi:hypothetical protein